MKYPINKYNSAVSNEIKNEVATRDATFYMSVLNALPNPDPILRKTGTRIQTYRELSADWEVFSAIELIHSGLKELEWEIDPGDTPATEVEFIEEMVRHWDPYEIMTQCIEARNFGYQPFENIWETHDNRWIISGIIGKPPEWFNYSTENRLQFISKDSPMGKTIEDPKKFIVARNRPSYNNPYGESHYSRLFWPVTFKKGGMTFWIKFLEKYGMPWAVGKQPRGTKKGERDKLLNNLHKMIQDAVAVINDDESVDLKESPFKASSTGTYQTFLNYCDKVINKVILSNEMSMGTSQDGGEIRGNAGQNYQVSKQVIMSVARMAMYVINEAIKMMWAVNFTSSPPEINIYAPKDVQKPLAERDKTLTDQGVKFNKKYYQNAYALAEDEFDLKEEKEPPSPPSQPPTPPPADPPDPEETNDGFQESGLGKVDLDTVWTAVQIQQAKNKSGQFRQTPSLAKALGLDLEKLREVLANKKKDGTSVPPVAEYADPIEENFYAGLEELEELIETAVGEESRRITQEILEEQFAPLIELVNSADSYDDVKETLATAYPEMNTEELEDRLAKAYFIADIIGRITEQENQEVGDDE